MANLSISLLEEEEEEGAEILVSDGAAAALVEASSSLEADNEIHLAIGENDLLACETLEKLRGFEKAHAASGVEERRRVMSPSLGVTTVILALAAGRDC
mmetsp:Transcript_24378/g.50605  ORF Transcript_24378/g.50605 Transcript_24378/m.50605 type:complete len:99 (-) Transcript_24378:7-303(-)